MNRVVIVTIAAFILLLFFAGRQLRNARAAKNIGIHQVSSEGEPEENASQSEEPVAVDERVISPVPSIETADPGYKEFDVPAGLGNGFPSSASAISGTAFTGEMLKGGDPNVKLDMKQLPLSTATPETPEQ